MRVKSKEKSNGQQLAKYISTYSICMSLLTSILPQHLINQCHEMPHGR